MEEIEYEWHQRKRWSNLTKHGIDFEDAIGVFEGPVFVRRSDRSGEQRFVAVGEVDGRVVAVTYTVRGDIYRIISARQSRKNERRRYHAGTAAPGG